MSGHGVCRKVRKTLAAAQMFVSAKESMTIEKNSLEALASAE
ncbi:hypothetical protein SAMN05428989_0936 [Pseudoxanthomonas sp. GM95]|nr:hypothetical protein SAMN05428989_0936 [Pseudoxanthomonas sp. GM95]